MFFYEILRLMNSKLLIIGNIYPTPCTFSTKHCFLAIQISLTNTSYIRHHRKIHAIYTGIITCQQKLNWLDRGIHTYQMHIQPWLNFFAIHHLSTNNTFKYVDDYSELFGSGWKPFPVGFLKETIKEKKRPDYGSQYSH